LRGLTREGFDETEVKDRIEVASINMQRETNMAEINLLERRLHDIHQALDAIDEGIYGICERCGNVIEPERLQANPAARLCIACQKAVEEAG
jgi:RNA polymerase-binding protein DksA